MLQKENKILGYLSYIFMLFFRVVPINTRSGIFQIGHPTKDSPVIVTANYSLTVQNVVKALKGIDCHLMIVPTKGINVWCASVGKIFTTEKLLFSIRAFGLEGIVNHRNLIVPQLAAPGISKWSVLEQSGWNVNWGPVSINSLKSYLSNYSIKAVCEQDQRATFNLTQVLEMTCAITGSFFIRFSIFVIIIFGIKVFALFPILIWLSVFPAYYNYSLNEKINWYVRPYTTTSILILFFSILTGLYIQLIILGLAIILLLNWSLYSYLPYVTCKYSSKFFGMAKDDINVNESKCSICGECLSVCPVGALEDNGNNITICNSSCVTCGGCENQCQFDAIENVKHKKGLGIFSH